MESSTFLNIDELADHILPHVKEGLEKHELHNVCLGFLDGTLRIQVYPQMQDDDWREKFLWAMVVLGSSVSMDAIAFVSDAYTTLQSRKSDGSEWEHDDMSKAFRDPSSPDHHLVTEALMINIFDRTGTGAMLTIHYKRQPDDSITFGHRASMVEGERESGFTLSGVIGDGLRAAMLQEPVTSKMKEAGVDPNAFGLDPVEIEAHAACAGVKTVVSHGVPVALAPRSEREWEIFKDSFANGPQFGPNPIKFEEL